MFKKLKSLFVVEEGIGIEEQLDQLSRGEKPVEAPKQVKINKSETSAEIPNEAQVFESTVTGPAKPNKQFTDILLKAIDAQNLEGPDYLEFKTSLKSLEGVIEDEATRYKSSFAVLKSTGVTKELLLESGNHYINVLQKEKQKFESTFQDQQNKQVLAREESIKKYFEGIQKRKEQLQTLIIEIEDMEKKLAEAKIEINEAANKVQMTKDQFLASHRSIVSQIESDFEKIKLYI